MSSNRQVAAKQETRTRTRMRELARREGSDVDVSLFWRPEDNVLMLLLVEVPTDFATAERVPSLS